MKITAPTPAVLAVSLGLAAALGLAGCAADQAAPGTGSTHSSDHGTPASGAAETSAGSATQSSAGHNDADVLFAQMMIPHHAQAVEMSDILLAKTGLPGPVTALATRIKDAQAPEIQTMTGWLEGWKQPTAASGHTGHSMAGMLGEQGIADLQAAQGTDAARLFLEQMIGHHEGAVEMAQQEINGGSNPEAIRLAEAIVTAQEAEISEMRELLAGL